MDAGHLPSHSRKLVKPIELSVDKCNILEFNKVDDDYTETFDEDAVYELDEVSQFTKLELVGAGDDNEEISGFDKFKQCMLPIPYGPEKTVDDKLMKRIKVKGSGDTPTPGCQVQVHYMYYRELMELPIDITYLRKKFPEKFRVGINSLLPAFDYSVMSMKKGEKADFFASSELCFGKLGCPPRIPPNADLLFEIELVDFSTVVDVRSSADLEPASADNCRERTFQESLKTAQSYGASAKVVFGNRNLNGAIRLYRDAARTLYNAKVESEEEQRQLEESLCKFYKNLMVCYNKQKQYSKSCDAAKNAVLYASHFASTDVKLYFLWGRALDGLLEWKTALNKLRKALSLATHTKQTEEISRAIQEVEQNMKNYLEREKQFCSGIFASHQDSTSNDSSINTSTTVASISEIRNDETAPSEEEDRDAFIDLMTLMMGEFKMSSDAVEREVLGTQSEFTRDEVKTIKKMAAEMNLICTVAKDIVITKKY